MGNIKDFFIFIIYCYSCYYFIGFKLNGSNGVLLLFLLKWLKFDMYDLF